MNVDHYAKQDCAGWNAAKEWPQHNKGPCQGIDRAACNRGDSSGCHYSQMKTLWNPITNKRPDCWDQDNYCDTSVCLLPPTRLSTYLHKPSDIVLRDLSTIRTHKHAWRMKH